MSEMLYKILSARVIALDGREYLFAVIDTYLRAKLLEVVIL